MLRNEKYIYVKPSSLWKSDIISKALRILGERTFNSMKKRGDDYIREKARNAIERGEGSFHVFGMAYGDNGKMNHGDHSYVWEKAREVYPDPDIVKRFLGTLQMLSFAESEYNWVYLVDDEKKEKLSNNELPMATRYFLDNEQPATLDDLMSKFNKGRNNKPR